MAKRVEKARSNIRGWSDVIRRQGERTREENAKVTDLFIGIDPGVTGCIATCGKNLSNPQILDMPRIGKGSKWMMDYGVLKEWLLPQVRLRQSFGISRQVFAVLELVHSQPTDGVAGSFSFGRAREAMEAVLAFSNVPYVLVPPAKWMGHFKIKRTPNKSGSVTEAKRLYGHAPELLTVKRLMCTQAQLPNRSDALLMAAYAHHLRG